MNTHAAKREFGVHKIWYALLHLTLLCIASSPAYATRYPLYVFRKLGCGDALVPYSATEAYQGQLRVYIDPAINALNVVNVRLPGRNVEVTVQLDIRSEVEFAAQQWGRLIGLQYIPVGSRRDANVVVETTSALAASSWGRGIPLGYPDVDSTQNEILTTGVLRLPRDPGNIARLLENSIWEHVASQLAPSGAADPWAEGIPELARTLLRVTQLHEWGHTVGLPHAPISDAEVTELERSGFVMTLPVEPILGDIQIMMAYAEAYLEFFFLMQGRYPNWNEIRISQRETVALQLVNASSVLLSDGLAQRPPAGNQTGDGAGGTGEAAGYCSATGECTLTGNLDPGGAAGGGVSGHHHRSARNAREVSGVERACEEPQLRIDEEVEDTVTHEIVYDNPTWLDLEGDGNKDFCTVDGEVIRCYRNDNGVFVKVLQDRVHAPGAADSRAFVRFRPEHVGYCRLIEGSTLSCRVYVRGEDGLYGRTGGWSTPVVAGEVDETGTATWDSGLSNYRWYVPLTGEEGRLHYCRLRDSGRELRCRGMSESEAGVLSFDGQDVAYRGTTGVPFTAGVLGSRAWVTVWGEQGKGYCALSEGLERVSCVVFDPARGMFKEEPVVLVQAASGSLDIAHDWDDSARWRWVRAFWGGVDTGTNAPRDDGRDAVSAFCYEHAYRQRWSCVPAKRDSEGVDLPFSVGSSWLAATQGWVKFPGVDQSGVCGVEPAARRETRRGGDRRWEIICKLDDEAAGAMGFSQEQSALTATRQMGEVGVNNGNQAWLSYVEPGTGLGNALFCRRQGVDLRCTRIRYQGPNVPSAPVGGGEAEALNSFAEEPLTAAELPRGQGLEGWRFQGEALRTGTAACGYASATLSLWDGSARGWLSPDGRTLYVPAGAALIARWNRTEAFEGGVRLENLSAGRTEERWGSGRDAHWGFNVPRVAGRTVYRMNIETNHNWCYLDFNVVTVP